MVKQTAFSAFIALILLAAGARAVEITVWDSTGFRGASATFDRTVRNLDDLGWNDRISSVRIDSGRWELCRENDFRTCQTLSAEAIEALGPGWNDAISSLRPVAAAAVETETRTETPEQVGKRIYRAILGREADPQGLGQAAAEIKRGRTEIFIRGMLQSAEYRRLRSQRSSAQILDQMYRAVLDRPADSAARTYLTQLDRGEDAEVVLALFRSEEYGTDIGESDAGVSSNIDVEAIGSGFVVSGTNGRYDSLSGVKVALGRDGRARIDLTGTTPQTLTGTWTRESDDLLLLSIPDISGRRANGRGFVMMDGANLARVEVTSGRPGSRSSTVITFLADDYTPPREETACLQEIRAQLEDERGTALAMLFLAPDRSRLTTGRERLVGDALVLADAGSLAYRCDVDIRRGTVVDASSERR